MGLIGSLLRFITERGARGHSYQSLGQRLATSGEEVADRTERMADTPKNRAQANHIIGIERWGQRRLRVALGEPLLHDEYDGYRVQGDTVAALREAFRSTRAETLALVQQLEAAGLPPATTVPHNDMGETTLRGWLYYLTVHASRESRRLR